MVTGRGGDVRPGDGSGDLDEEKAVERLFLFTDAVVAIAITLLVLPLVDLAGEDVALGDLWDDHRGQFIAFAVSFVVIAQMWVGHHTNMRGVPRCTTPLVWSDMLWLATIVFLPFTTELLGGPRGDDTSTRVAYVSSILACTLAFNLLTWVSVGLRREAGRRAPRPEGGWIASGLVAVALVIVAVADVGLWPLFILVLAGPLTALVTRRA